MDGTKTSPPSEGRDPSHDLRRPRAPNRPGADAGVAAERVLLRDQALTTPTLVALRRMIWVAGSGSTPRSSKAALRRSAAAAVATRSWAWSAVATARRWAR